MKIKILFLIGSFEVGGMERQLAEIIKNLPQEKFEIHLFLKSLKAHYLTQEEITRHVKSVQTLERESFRISDIFRVIRCIEEVKPDVIFSFSNILSHFCGIARFLYRHHFVLVNGSIRDARRIFKFEQRLERMLYSRYNFVVANSNAGLMAYHQSGKTGRFVLYNGYNSKRTPKISKQEARDHLNLPKELFTVVMVAAMSDRKDHITFIKAANDCLKSDENMRFLLVGNGPKRAELEKYCTSLGAGNSIKFMGERKDVEEILIASDLSVLTSADWHGEGISNSILESLACGTPVIATDNGGTKEIINENNGIIIETGDYRALSEKILYLKNNPLILEGFSDNGKKTVIEKFSIETMIKNFEGIINNVTKLR